MREEWTYKKLGEVCEIFGRIGFRGYTREDYVNTIKEGAISLSPSNIINNQLDFSNCTYITWDKYNQSPEIKIVEGDVLFVKTASVGKCAYVSALPHESTINPQFVVFKNISIYNRFLFYQLLSSSFQYKVKRITSGTSVPTITQKDLSELGICYPNIEEQQRIVSELDLLSSIIEKKKAQLKEYDQLAQSIFYDMFGDPVENPKGWEVKRYRDFAEIIGGYAFNSKSFVDSGVPVLKIGNINTGVLRLEEICYYPYTPSLKRYEVHSGDLVISLTGTTGKDDYGNICIIPSYADTFYLNQRNAILRPNETCNNIFLQYVFKQRTIKKELTKNNHGVRQANILNQDILGLSIPLPPLSLQQSFASKIEAIERQKALIQQSIAEVQMLFDSRMDDWFA